MTVVFRDLFFVVEFESTSLLLFKLEFCISSNISWASLTNEMEGSFRLNSAQALDLKLIPWKHAKEMWDPRSSNPPPRTWIIQQYLTSYKYKYVPMNVYWIKIQFWNCSYYYYIPIQCLEAWKVKCIFSFQQFFAKHFANAGDDGHENFVHYSYLLWEWY